MLKSSTRAEFVSNVVRARVRGKPENGRSYSRVPILGRVNHRRAQAAEQNNHFAAKRISLTTDYGLTDWFVGTMKGVILKIQPHQRSST